MIKNNLRYNRLADGNPVPYVEGSDGACFTLRTTGDASENGSFRSIAFVYSMAIGLLPVGVMWINYNDGNARFLYLVLYKQPDLEERPRIVDVPVAIPNSCPHPYAFKVSLNFIPVPVNVSMEITVEARSV